MFYNLDIIEEINDGLLYLRKIRKNDADFFYSSLNEKDIINYLSLGPLATLEDSKRLIKKYLKFWYNFAQFNYVIELRESKIESIGTINLWNINWTHKRCEVGIWLIPSYWNRGYATKALNLIKNIGFNHLKLNRLEAHIALENKRSISLFKKCDFKEEGQLKQFLNFQGVYHDALILACLKN